MDRQLSGAHDAHHYHHFLNLLQETHPHRDQKIIQSYDYKKVAENILASCTFMDYCSDSEKQEIYHQIKIRHFYQGQVIYQRNQPCDEIVIVLSGILKLGWHTHDGRQIIHRFIPTTGLLNIIYLVSQSPFEHDYIAHEASILAIIPGAVFQKILQQNQRMLYQVFKMVCQRTRLLDNDIYHQSTQSLRVQITRQFIYLVEYFSSQHEGVIQLSLRLSQENFADLLKVSRQSIRKEMQWFIDQGIIETRYNQILIRNLSGLNRILDEF